MGKFALLIGVSDYKKGLPALPAATQDIVALERILADPSLGQFDAVQQLANPSRDQMAGTIERWLNERKAEDLIVLFFSGHGVKDDRRNLYFAASDTQKEGNRLIRSSAFEARTLHNFLSDSKPRQQVIILDCCFSGAFGDLLAKDDGKVAIEEQLAAEGRVVMTSTSSVDYAFEDKKTELSVYTRYLVEGIEKGTADMDGNGFITVDELHKFASRKVKETAPAMSPDMIMLQGQGHDIRLASAPQEQPALRYRKKVEELGRQGKLTVPAQALLNSLRQEYGLTSEEAEAIEAEVFEPFYKYQRKLDQYRDVLTKCLEAQADLDSDHIADLKQLQKRFGLTDADVSPIEKELAGKVFVSIDPTVGNWQRRRLLFGMVGGALLLTGTGRALLRTNDTDKQNRSFSFKTEKVNEQGKVMETIAGKAEYITEDLGNGVMLEMVRIPGGTFLMGAAQGEEGAYDDEYPQHEVSVPEFWMGKFAVTQAQWAAVAAMEKVERDLEPDPSGFKGAKRPVEQVSWHEAVEFCKRLSRRSEWVYSLPSEAQWEYACRAGTNTPFYFGPTITTGLVNFDGNYTYGNAPKGEYREETTEVGSFSPNLFGLYDMHGNVLEWCLDGWRNSYKGAPVDGSVWESSSESNKVLRGGSWGYNPRFCRSALRVSFAPDGRSDYIGFRVSCSAPRT